MKIAPVDIAHQSFRRVLRGVDPQEVEAFLRLVSTELEGAAKELQELRDELRRKEEELSVMRTRERAVQDAMIAAQKASEDIREAARKEADITLSGAELQAEKIVQSAHQRYVQIVAEINEMKRQRAEYEHGLRSLIQGHAKLLDAFASAEPQVEYLPAKKKGEER